MLGRLLVLCLCLAAVLGNPEPLSRQEHIADIEKRLDALLALEANMENEIVEDEVDEDPFAQDGEDETMMEDPCAMMFCPAGRECVVGEGSVGSCVCVASCTMESDPRRRVCSNHNETWMSDCDLYRQQCLCEHSHNECQDEMYEHLHIDYYGQCQQLPECLKEEFDDFPRRMREWLFTVMRDMADRQILSSHYQKLEKEAEEDDTQKWTNAVIWKWCDLDGHPKDKVVSRHELFPIRAPLYTLEHCIAPFLDSCDPDDDHFITITEWGRCLKLDQEDLSDMDDLCEDIREQD